MTYYNLRSADSEFRITKFDDDLNPIEGSSYIVSFEECTCPAGSRPTCRHRQMLPHLIDHLDSPEFYCFETGEWEDPVGALEQDAGEGPEPSTLAADLSASPSQDVAPSGQRHPDLRGGPATPNDIDLPQSEYHELPKGVTALTLDDVEKVHNTIAEAVGEPKFRRRV